MKKIVVSIFTLLTVSMATCPETCKNGCASYKIVTGGKGKTYEAFGKDLKNYVAPDACIDLKVINTNGSIDNIRKLKSKAYPKVKFAIVQSDVLQFYKRQLNSNNINEQNEAKDIISKIRVIAPLYNEELHFFVKADSNITTFSDLRDKKISVGKSGSGNALTAFTVCKELFNKELDNQHSVIQGFFDGLDYLNDGRVDAVLLVSGQPVSYLQNATNMSEAARKIKLLEYSEKDGSNISYYISTLRKTNYPWLQNDIQTLSTKAYLITYNYKRQYTVKNLSAFVKSLYRNLATLKNHNLNNSNPPHQKWQEVDNICNLQHLPGGWKYHDIVKNTCEQLKNPNETSNPTKCSNYRAIFDRNCQNK